MQERYRGFSRLKYLQEYVKFFVRCAVMSTRLFISRRYKVIHVHNMPDALVFAALVPKLFGSKVILDIHDPMPETYGSKYRGLTHNAVSRMLLLQENLSVAFADRTITVSDPLKNGILIMRGYPPENISVVANFADDEIFKPMPYPIVEGKVRFVFHGTILERYGLGCLWRLLLRFGIEKRSISELLVKEISARSCRPDSEASCECCHRLRESYISVTRHS